MRAAVASVLKDRILLGDGTSIVEPERVVELMLSGLEIKDILVTEVNHDVIEFNKRADAELKVFTSPEVEIDASWLLPEQYLSLDLAQYFEEKLTSQVEPDMRELAEIRIANELAEVKARGFENGIRTIIYVVDTLKANNQLWGIGRGSSCASYLLFLIGLHAVDCLKYNVSFTEFFHD